MYDIKRYPSVQPKLNLWKSVQRKKVGEIGALVQLSRGLVEFESRTPFQDT